MVAKKDTSRKGSEKSSGGLLTLSAVAKATGISMPTLQRYKKEFQRRIPSVGSGRKQRYPEEALDVFRKIKEENMKKRGRPKKKAKKTAKKKAAKKIGRKKAAKKKTVKKKAAKKRTGGKRVVRKKAARKKAARKKVARKTTAKRRVAKKKAGGKRKAAPSAIDRGLLTLSEIGRRTGISYPTLLRYVKVYADKIPRHGKGRKRRFPEEAVQIFEQLRSQSRRGRRKAEAIASEVAGAARRAVGIDVSLTKRIKELERAQAQISKQLDSVIKTLRQPLKLTIKSR